MFCMKAPRPMEEARAASGEWLAAIQAKPSAPKGKEPIATKNAPAYCTLGFRLFRASAKARELRVQGYVPTHEERESKNSLSENEHIPQTRKRGQAYQREGHQAEDASLTGLPRAEGHDEYPGEADDVGRDGAKVLLDGSDARICAVKVSIFGDLFGAKPIEQRTLSSNDGRED